MPLRFRLTWARSEWINIGFRLENINPKILVLTPSNPELAYYYSFIINLKYKKNIKKIVREL